MQWTVGPLDPAVYWRRRAIAGALVVLVLVLLIVLLVGGSSGASKGGPTGAPAVASPTPSDSPTPSPTPTASASTSTSPSPSASTSATTSASASASTRASASSSSTVHHASDGCTTDQLTLTASTNHTVYRVGDKPVLAMTVKNTSAYACTVDLGASQRELLVTSGPAHTWSSKDCAPATGRAITVLKPGQHQSFTVTWSGKRSQAGCAGDRPVATAGTYRLTASLGRLTSDAAVFRLR